MLIFISCWYSFSPRLVLFIEINRWWRYSQHCRRRGRNKMTQFQKRVLVKPLSVDKHSGNKTEIWHLSLFYVLIWGQSWQTSCDVRKSSLFGHAFKVRLEMRTVLPFADECKNSLLVSNSAHKFSAVKLRHPSEAKVSKRYFEGRGTLKFCCCSSLPRPPCCSESQPWHKWEKQL